MKRLGKLSHQDIRQLSRDEIESELTFQGFIVISCPLKPDSQAVLKEIMNSSHKVSLPFIIFDVLHLCIISFDTN